MSRVARHDKKEGDARNYVGVQNRSDEDVRPTKKKKASLGAGGLSCFRPTLFLEVCSPHARAQRTNAEQSKQRKFGTRLGQIAALRVVIAACILVSCGARGVRIGRALRGSRAINVGRSTRRARRARAWRRYASLIGGGAVLINGRAAGRRRAAVRYCSRGCRVARSIRRGIHSAGSRTARAYAILIGLAADAWSGSPCGVRSRAGGTLRG